MPAVNVERRCLAGTRDLPVRKVALMNRSVVRVASALLLVVLLDAAAPLSAGPQAPAVRSVPSNLEFEEGQLGQVPTSWTSPPGTYGFSAELTEESPKRGKRCAQLRSRPDAPPVGAGFGNLMQAIDASGYRGRRVRFKGAVRFESLGPGSRAQLWLRVDRPQSRVGFFDNMGDRPIVSSLWQYYEIIADIDDDAASVNFGLLLTGKGKAWLDDVSLEDLGRLTVLAEPPRALTIRGLQNLLAFARLFGYVRHFHPSDQAVTADWEAFAVEGVRVAESARDERDLVRKLEMLFRPIAPTLQIFLTGKRASNPSRSESPRLESPLRVVFWRHTGFGGKSTPQGGFRAYFSERVSKDAAAGKLPEGTRDPRKPHYSDLGGGVSSLLPLSLFADAKGTLPRTSVQPRPSTPSLIKYSGNDRATRLADIILAWNIFQHFYPYFDVVSTDWPRSLENALRTAATDADEKLFLITLRRMVAALQDGHGGVYHSSESYSHTIPLLWEWVEGSLVVTHVAGEGVGSARVGDIVLKVDGKPSAQALTEKQDLISGATPQWRRYTALQQLRLGEKDSEVKLDVRSQPGEQRTVLLKRTLAVNALAEPRPPKVHEIASNVFYLDLGRMKDNDFYEALPRLEKARGIVFDLRGYPSVSPDIICHLINAPVNSARWNVPIITNPDRKELVEFDTRGRWTLQPKSPRLTAKVAFLTDGRAISYAESYLGIIEAYKLAEIVGEATAGTNGNVNPFTLPGGYRVVWTGMKVLKHDGSQHHGIGIKPTVPASRTIRGITEKRDEQLERALALVGR